MRSPPQGTKRKRKRKRKKAFQEKVRWEEGGWQRWTGEMS
jgi:hypothetical protein